MKIPLTAYELIEQLATQYGEVIYDPQAPHDEFLMRSGERRLVVTLLRRMEDEIHNQRNGDYVDDVSEA